MGDLQLTTDLFEFDYLYLYIIFIQFSAADVICHNKNRTIKTVFIL